MTRIEILPFAPAHRDAVLQLTVDAWTPVFARTRDEVPGYVLDAFYPDGWERRQRDDVAAMLDTDGARVHVALVQSTLAGFLGLRFHPEDRMGEVHIVAVDPRFQRIGVGAALLAHAERDVRARGLAMMMVETMDDSGHAPARRACEAAGYDRWPVARYFKRL